MTAIVAYQGAPGAFAEEACRRFLPGCSAIARPTFDAVARAVLGGEAALGLLPIENSIAGPVPGVAELIAESGLAVDQCHELPVRQQLMARPGVELGQVKIVASHPIALAQCANTLARLGVEVEEAANTALAAEALARSGDRTRAVIASEAAAAVYGLTILLRDVHDRPDNVTTFCVVTRSSEPGP